MFPIVNGVLFIIVYLALNHFVQFSFEINAIVIGMLLVYFAVIYLWRNNQDLLKKMIVNMDNVK